MLLELAPGLRVVRRGPAHLQLGLYDDQRLVLPRTSTVERVLDQVLTRQRIDADDPDAAAVARRLVESRCATPRRDSLDRATRRAACRVSVRGGLGPDPAPLLAAAGLRAVAARSAEPDVVLVLSRGELAREEVDDLIRNDVPHLVVRAVDGGVVVGPFVEPGRTACLRCIDAHLSLRDPDHLPVLTRYVEATRTPRRDGRDELGAPVLAHLALAWAVRDLLAHVDGEEPTTWSRTIRLGPTPASQVQTAWPRHPDCGCCWPGNGVPSGRMCR